jgi:hypothetical protein
MNSSAAILSILLIGSALGGAPKQPVNGYPMLDAYHIYRSGEQVRVGKSHGSHSGLLTMDDVYFVRPLNVTITRRNKVSNSFFNWEGSLVADVRHATSAAWERRTFVGRCENFDLTVGQIENGAFDDKEEELRIGNQNSTCEFRAVDNSKNEASDTMHTRL